MDGLSRFLFDTMPVGIIVYGAGREVLFMNRRAERFLKRFNPPPPELADISGRIFNALRQGTADELFPGEVHVIKKLEGSPSTWTFRFHFSQTPQTMVCVYIVEDPAAGKVDLNVIRREYHLTRRETDILRYALNGMRNTEVADELEITEQTVKDHLSNVYMKTGTANRMDLLRLFLNRP